MAAEEEKAAAEEVEEEGLAPADLFLLRGAAWRARLLDLRDAARAAGSPSVSEDLLCLGELCRLCTHTLQLRAEAAAGHSLRGVPESDLETARSRLRRVLDGAGRAQLRQRFGLESARDGPAARLLMEGYCAVSSAMPAERLAAASAALARQRERLEGEMRSLFGRADLGAVRECGRVGLREVTSRAENHFDLQVEGLEAALGLVEEGGERADWLQVVEEALGGPAEVRNSGVFLALPSSEPQEWHADGPHRDCEVHQRPYAVNVLLPLVSMAGEAGERRGRTQLLESSHLLWRACLGPRQVAPSAEERMDVRAPELDLGDIVMFDHRLRHRAGANTSERERPVAYLTYCRASDPWVDPNVLDRVPLRLAGELLGRQPSCMEEIDD